MLPLLTCCTCCRMFIRGSALTSLTSSALTLPNMLPLLKLRPMSMLHKKIQKVYKKGTLGLTAGHGVIMSPCCSPWPLRCQKHSGAETSRREKTGWVDVFLRWLGWLKMIKFWCFFKTPWRAKSIQRAAETQFFTLKSHACQSKWMSFFDKSHKYQHFVP